MTKDNKQLYVDITMIMHKLGVPVHLTIMLEGQLPECISTRATWIIS